jgi:3'-5' exoribonuclease
MSSKLFVRDIQPSVQVDEVFRIADRQIRANRQGNSYMLMQLQDRTGVISAMRWNADERLAERYPKGSFVRIQGVSQLHNGVLQLIINQIQSIDSSEISQDDFEAIDREKNDQHWNRMLSILDSLQDPTTKQICLAIVNDPEWGEGLRLAPAGVKTHHAYPGGLLEHIVSLMELAVMVANHYPDIDRDLLVAGALVHDLGKLIELSYQNELNYTDSGQLLGHLVQGVTMLDQVAQRLKELGVPVDAERLLRLQHIVVSHHGTLEHGSPKVPMTLEAYAFHYLDEMDAKLNAARELVQQDRTKDPWTPFHPNLGRKLYKSSFGIDRRIP